MTDNSTPQLANFGPLLNSVSAEQLESFKALLLKAGNDKADVEKALAPTQASATAAASAPPAPMALSLDPFKRPTFSDADAKALTENLRTFGGPDVLRALDAAGKADAPDAAVASAANDARTDEERAFDASLGGVAADAYDLNGLYLNRGNIPVGDLAAFDAELRMTLSAMEVPPVMGRGIADALIESANKVAALEPGPARALWAAEQRAILQRVGKEPFDDVVRWAAHAVSRIPEEIRAAFFEHGAFESAHVMAQLAAQGRRLFAREQMAERRGK